MTDEPEITNEAYARWLQAQRPPFDWFMGQPVIVQEVLAEQGAIHRIEATIDMAKAVQDPELFQAESFAATDPEEEAVLVRRLAAQTVAHMLGGEAPQTAPVEPPPPTGLSMAGVIERRERADAARKRAVGEGRSFLGRKPDSIRGETA